MKDLIIKNKLRLLRLLISWYQKAFHSENGSDVNNATEVLKDML